jgi:hypothetical protein
MPVIARAKATDQPRNDRSRSRPRGRLNQRSRGATSERESHATGFARRAEDVVAALAREEGFGVRYEPEAFRTGRTAQGDRHIRPDFEITGFTTGYRLFIEVTIGQTHDKLCKISGAIEIARSDGHDLVILLFNRGTIRRLQNGHLTFRAAIQQALTEQYLRESVLAA